MKQKSYVVIADAPKMDYMTDFVALPKNYGTDAYFERGDVKAIRATVLGALEELDKRCHFTEMLKNNRHVLIKPNLVSVYHNSGFDEKDYPETTDPRVFEAVVGYIAKYTNRISIVESSGKPVPTPVSFSMTGYDRIAKYYGTKLVPLEQQTVVRYMLPKAEVMKEVYLPEILDEVVRGEAFYVSVPKMKTNLYTGVTLGFKNAMGTIPYFLRERDHSFRINKKLADLLYLFKPYSEEDIAALPMRKMAMGNCGKTARHLVKYYAGGCCDPAKCMAVVCKASGVRMPIMSLKNRSLLKLVRGILKTVSVRRKLIKNGFWVDCPHGHTDKVFELPELTGADREKDYIVWPLPVMNEQEKKQQLKDQYRIVSSMLA